MPMRSSLSEQIANCYAENENEINNVFTKKWFAIGTWTIFLLLQDNLM